MTASVTKEPSDHPDHEGVWRDGAWRGSVRRQLLRWYQRHARDLPWRNNPTAYHVWVSEIMLQQTQVATVIPYYHRFLEAFPTVQHLAESDEQHLLALWEGLGYYRRARSMHAAAKTIVQDHGGAFPESYDEVLALPGIGRYTAGAILSISNGQRLPILEGNTQRVFSRWVALRGSPTETPAKRLLWRIAEAMLPRKGVGLFNQAAMELGALVCKPRDPGCDRCPVATLCSAKLMGLQEQIPGKLARIASEPRTEFAVIVADAEADRVAGPKFLLRPLPEGRRWGGLWDFPRTTSESLDSITDAADQLSRQIGVSLVPGIRLATIKHAVTKFRITLHVHQAEIEGLSARPARPWRYVSLEEMQELPMSVTGRRIAKMLASDRQMRLPV